MIRKFKTATIQFFVGLLLVAAISISLVRGFLWGVENYKTELEHKIYEFTTIPVEIGKLRAKMRGFSPELILKDIHVIVPDNSKEHPIKLEEIRVGINLMDLMFTHQVLSSSWITLVGVKLSVVRKEDGGLSIDGLNTEGSEQPLWLLKGGRYEVLKSEITWLDKQRHASPIRFDNIDVLIKNDTNSDNHEIHLISLLSEEIGKSIRVSTTFQGNVFKQNDITGLLYIKGRDIQLAKLLTGEQPLGLKVKAGKGDFELWSQWEKSRVIALTGNVQAENISFQKQQQVFVVDQLKTDFTSFIQPLGWQVGATDFIAKIGDRIWPAANFSFSVNKELTQLAALIDQLELQEFSELIQFFVPLDEHKKVLISKLGLRGLIKDLAGYFDIEKNTYAINGEFNNIYASSFAKLPQIENLSGSIKGSHEQGIIALNTHQGSLFFSDLFRKPFLIDELTGQLSWQQQAESWLVKSEHLILNVKDAQSENSLSVLIPKNEGSVFLDLQSSFSKLDDVSAIPDYYPVSMMHKDVLSWLDKAFVSGKIGQGGLLVYGELNQFPFINGQGVFEVFLDAKEVELNVAPSWPHLNNVNADILFQKDSLTVTATHAEVNGMIIPHTLVKIPSFEKSKYLIAEGRAEGGMANGLGFLKKTPLHNLVDGFLNQVAPSGALKVALDFKVPLVEGVGAKVNGVAHLKSATLNIKPIDFKITRINGDLRFTEKGLFSKKIRAKALGYPLAITVDTKGFNTSVSAVGITDFNQVQKQFSFLNSDFLGKDRVKGEINYQVMLDLPEGENNSARLRIDTNLAGVAVNLPGVLKKSALQDKNLNLSLSLNNDELMPLSLAYGSNVKVKMSIDKQQNEVHSAHIVVGSGHAVLPNGKGIKLQVKQDIFDITEWTGLLGEADNNQQQSSQTVSEISFVTKDLHWKNKQYGAFEITMKREDRQWQGKLACSAAKGSFVIPVNSKGKDKIELEMDYLNLSELMQVDFQGEGFNNEDLPLIDVFSQKTLWDAADLGVLKIKTDRTVEGVRFKRIDLVSKSHAFKMTADWLKKKSVTNFQGTLLTDDMGILLSKIGITTDLKDASANITYSGQWPNSPYQFSLAAVDANVDMQLKDGRISSIEPGLGRLLGLVAVEQWIKRLTLNFGDLFEEGLSFNSIKGGFKLTGGKAHTADLVVDAIPAGITIIGETDLITKALDYSVSVVPKSSGAIPIAGTIVSGIAGTITQAVTDDYKKGYFFGSKYQVTGKWGDIKVKAMHDEDGLFKKTWTALTK